MKCQATELSCAEASMARDVNSVLLSETIIPSLPRRSRNGVSSRATRRPEIDVAARHSRVTPSTIFRMRLRRPLANAVDLDDSPSWRSRINGRR
jgi:hypothetical protein